MRLHHGQSLDTASEIQYQDVRTQRIGKRAVRYGNEIEILLEAEKSGEGAIGQIGTTERENRADKLKSFHCLQYIMSDSILSG